MIYLKKILCQSSILLSLVGFSATSLADPYMLAFKTAFQIFSTVQSSNQEMEKTRLLNKQLRNIGESINSLADEIHEMRNLGLEADVEGLWGEYVDQWDDMIINSQDLKQFSYRIANLLASILKHANSDHPKYAVMLHVPYYSLHSLQMLVEKKMIKVRGLDGEWENYDKIRRFIHNGQVQTKFFMKIYEDCGRQGNIRMVYKVGDHLNKLKKLYNELKIDEHSKSLPESYDFDVNKKYWFITLSKFSVFRYLGIMPGGDIYETTNDQEWEKFNIIPAGDGKYHIKDCHGHFICADQSEEVRVANQPGPWETFSIERWGGKSKLRYKIKSVWGNYLVWDKKPESEDRYLKLGRPGSQFTIKEEE